MKNFKKIIYDIIKVFELFILPFIFISAIILKTYRKIGSKNLPLTSKLLKKIGIFPIINHYYEPMFTYPKKTLERRDLPGIFFDIEDQLKLLKKLNYQNEFNDFVKNNKMLNHESSYSINNGNFEEGDAEFLYGIIRYLKPSKIIEVGCGSSTKIINHALNLNTNDNVISEHTCIEPYEQSWLNEYKNIKLIRSKVEDCKIDWNNILNEGDILFIDSSHIIRPNGDVLYEYLTILPQLKSGVIVHIHDIFTPNNYPHNWLNEDVLFFNEQYLLEVLLENKARYKIYASLNYLKHKHFNQLKEVCTFLNYVSEPGSFYIKIN